MSSYHLNVTIKFYCFLLHRKGLSGVTMVVKGLGAGFHQSVEGVRFVPPSEQPSLQQKERGILEYAKIRGFKTVSTFNMTISRYKDFLEGNCACHFHKVSKLYILLSTDGFQERIRAWFHNQTENNRGPYGKLTWMSNMTLVIIVKIKTKYYLQCLMKWKTRCEMAFVCTTSKLSMISLRLFT